MATEQKYTIADVASRKGEGGTPVWMIYKDSVYDVTSYIPQHPAGDVMLEEAGGDCTQAFQESGHSSDALTILKKFKIGEIVDLVTKLQNNPTAVGRKKAGTEPLQVCLRSKQQLLNAVYHQEEKRYDANGKKKKKVVSAPPETGNRGCLRIITCGLVG